MFAIPYFVVFFTLFLNFSLQFDNKYLKKITIFFSFFVLFIFIGFRGFVSTDWMNYYPYFEKLDPGHPLSYDYLHKSNWEIATPALMYLFKKIHIDYFGFCLISAFFDLFLLNKIFIRYSNNVVLSYLFFFLFAGWEIEFNLLRCSKAILLFLVSISYIDKCWWKYILINIIGYFFHVTAIFYILFFFFYKSHVLENKKIIIVIWLIGLGLYVLRKSFSEMLLLSIADYLPVRMRWLVRKYTEYNMNKVSYGFGFGFLERFFSFWLLIFFQKKLCKDKHLIVFFDIGYIYYLAFFYMCDIDIFVKRLSVMTAISYWIIFPNIFASLKKKIYKYIFIGIFMSYSILKIYAVFGNDKSLKYETWLFETPDYNTRYSNNIDKSKMGLTGVIQ